MIYEIKYSDTFIQILIPKCMIIFKFTVNYQKYIIHLNVTIVTNKSRLRNTD